MTADDIGRVETLLMRADSVWPNKRDYAAIRAVVAEARAAGELRRRLARAIEAAKIGLARIASDVESNTTATDGDEIRAILANVEAKS